MRLTSFRIFIASVLLILSTGLQADSYKIIDPAHPTSVAEGKIEVVEIFWYGCPHCYDFEPHVQNWLDKKPEAAEFKRMPGIFSEKWIPHARAYYAAMEMGVLDQLHKPLFDALHEEKRNIYDKGAILKFVAQLVLMQLNSKSLRLRSC